MGVRRGAFAVTPTVGVDGVVGTNSGDTGGGLLLFSINGGTGTALTRMGSACAAAAATVGAAAAVVALVLPLLLALPTLAAVVVLDIGTNLTT